MQGMFIKDQGISIRHYNYNSYDFQEYCVKLAEDNHEQALVEVSKMNCLLMAETQEKICNTVAKKGDLVRAAEIADNILELETRGWALSDISKIYAEKDQEMKSLELIKKITEIDGDPRLYHLDAVRDFALYDLFEITLKKGNKQRAFELTEVITDEWTRNKALKKIKKFEVSKID